MSKPLTEVKISCPSGLKWTWQEHASPRTEQKREEQTMTWIQECTKNIRIHLLKMTRGGLEIKLEALTDMFPLLQITGNPLPDLGMRSLIYDTGPWKGENLLAGIEFFLPKERLPPSCHMWKPKMRQKRPHTHVNHTQQHHVGTNPPHPKHKALLRGRKLL